MTNSLKETSINKEKREINSLGFEKTFIVHTKEGILEISEKDEEKESIIFLIWQKAKEIWSILEDEYTSSDSWFKSFNSIEEAEKEIGFPIKCQFIVDNQIHHSCSILGKTENWDYLCYGETKKYDWESREYTDYLSEVEKKYGWSKPKIKYTTI